MFAVLYSPENVSFLPPPLEGGFTVPLRNQITRLPVPSDVIGRLVVSMETSWKQELLLAVCVCRVGGGGGLLVCLASIQKSSIAEKKAEKIKDPNVTYVCSGEGQVGVVAGDPVNPHKGSRSLRLAYKDGLKSQFQRLVKLMENKCRCSFT